MIKRVKELESKAIVNLGDIIRAIKSQVDTQQISTLGGKVQLEPLTYRHDGLICHFFPRF